MQVFCLAIYTVLHIVYRSFWCLFISAISFKSWEFIWSNLFRNNSVYIKREYPLSPVGFNIWRTRPQKPLMDSNSLQLAEISNTSNDLSTKFDLKDFYGSFFIHRVLSIPWWEFWNICNNWSFVVWISSKSEQSN